MARKRDVIVAVIIGGFFIIAVGLFALILLFWSWNGNESQHPLVHLIWRFGR